MKTGFGTAVRIGASSLGLLLLSCSRSNSVPQPPPPQTHTITIEGMRFEPADLTVRPGDTIVWLNKDLFAHTATAAGVFDSKQIEANGSSWRLTPTAIGDVPYICALHPTMKAMVRIKAADPATRSTVQ
jgi:plastocyanin